ncbi:hypothetical protein Ddye_002333 [Dipteronia dyeriana]|uniref:KIB1-4 beta-propeller domain-containing protein n=1 Tax=Dipteronia dyeriana TaxID=168575 RepID=A0AAE0CUD4_9ROSI|nr:hypothetical protein Ddye_002333 [Dipteronia dyeriana]
MAEVDVNDVVEGIGKQLKLSEDSLVPWLMLLRFCIPGFLFLLFQFALFKGMAIWYRIDILEEIAKQIKLPEDLVVFSGVCRLWRYAASKKNFRFRANVVPWLMLPPKEKGSDVRSFFSLSKGMSRQINLPDAERNKCFSSKGWLMVIYKDWSMYLLHPFSSLRIELPPIKTFHNWKALSTRYVAVSFIQKFVLSTSPSLESEDYTLVVIYGSTGKLAYFRPGFKTWIAIDSCQHTYSDVIYCRGMFYAIDVGGGITVIDIRSDNTAAAKRVVADLPLELVPREFRTKFYLVESAGKFLVVGRKFHYRITDYGTTAFRVVEVDLSRNQNEWSPVKNLGNRALFVGDNSSLSVQVFDNSNFKPNRIYFTEDWRELYFCRHYPEGVGRDMGIYNLQDGSIERIETSFIHRCKCSLYHAFNPPMWVEESFQ